MARNIVPRTDKGADLGTPAKRWNTVYADSVIANNVQGENLKAIEQSAGDEITLRSLIASAGSTPMSITVYDDIPITDDLIVPENIELNVKLGGKLSVSATKTLTINGSFSAGLYQVFSGDGSVLFGTSPNSRINPMWFGAIGDGVTDDAPAIRAAINSAYQSGGGVVYIPPGVYLLASPDETSATGTLLVKSKPNVAVIGAGMERTILRATNNWRNESRGIAILYNESEETVENFAVMDLTVDFNGQNNLVQSGWSGSALYNRLGAYRCKNVVIKRVYFKNAAGHHCIYLGSDPSLHTNCVISDCIINNVSTAIPGDQDVDHTSIYVAMSNAVISNNILTNNTLAVETAIEAHGDYNIVCNNIINNYKNGIMPVAGELDNVKSVDVHDNIIWNCINGIRVWASSNRGFTQLKIKNNIVYLSAGNGCHGINHSLPEMASDCLLTQHLVIEGNIIIGDPGQVAGKDSRGIVIDRFGQAVVSENYIYNVSCEGIWVKGSSITADLIDISQNTAIRFGYTTNSSHSRGIAVTSPAVSSIQLLKIENNTLIADTSMQPLYGVFLNTTMTTMISQIHIATNRVKNISTYKEIWIDYIPPSEQKIIIKHVGNATPISPTEGIRASIGSEWYDLSTNRRFRYVKNNNDWTGWRSQEYGTAVPTIGNYREGDIVWNSSPTAGGYIGWVCVTAGNPGTWKGFGSIAA